MLPQTCEKLAEYDGSKTSGKELEWKVCLEFVGDFKSLNINELKQCHALMLQTFMSAGSLFPNELTIESSVSFHAELYHVGIQWAVAPFHFNSENTQNCI